MSYIIIIIHSNRACVLLFLILPVVMVQTIKHTNVGIAPAKRAYALYRHTLPLGTLIRYEGTVYIALTTLGNRAYPRCDVYARLPGEKPTHVPS